MRETAIVTTTIRMPRFLEAVLENVVRHARAGRTRIIVIGDEKTPPGVVKNDNEPIFAGRVLETSIKSPKTGTKKNGRELNNKAKDRT